MFILDFKHRGCSLTTNVDNVFSLKIYCECGKVFGEWKIEKAAKIKERFLMFFVVLICNEKY